MQKRSRKKMILTFTLIVCVMAFLCLVIEKYNQNKGILLLKRSDNPGSVLSIELGGNTVNGHIYGNTMYFFLPSHATSRIIVIDDSINKLAINGNDVNSFMIFRYETQYSCSVEVDGAVMEFPIIIYKSDNIDSMFVETESGSMDFVWEDKANRESAYIDIIGEDSKTKYSGHLEYIKGRGNSTWMNYKRPYSIKLESSEYLLGMNESKKWILVANAFDTTKIANKMAFDMNFAFGCSSYINSKWIDLYLNGNYVGNYLICEDVSVDKVDTEGNKKAGETYILEKDILGYSLSEDNSFTTNDGNIFVFKEPSELAGEKNQDAKILFENIELMMKNDSKELFEHFDMESFANRYFVDMITGNADMGISSLYFVKKSGSDIIYTGPAWDFDRSFGFFDFEVYGPDADMTKVCRDEILTWYEYLDNNEEFNAYCKEMYVSVVRPYVVKLIESGIDEYYSELSDSYEMDMLLWADSRRYYNSEEANKNYVKYYLGERLNMLDEKYQVNETPVEYRGSGAVHQLKVLFEGSEYIYQVEDGATFNELWELDQWTYHWWIDSDSLIQFNENLPILESMVIEPLPI